MSGNWRFELYYFDYALGFTLAGLVAAFTFGTMGADGFQFMDDVLQTSKHNLFYGFVAGGIFNLGNMALLGAISVAGMAIAYAVGFGVAIAIGAVLIYTIAHQGNPVLLFGGAAIALAAAVVGAMAYRSHMAVKLEEQARAGKLKTSAPKVSPKGVLLSVFAGLLLGSFPSMAEKAMTYGPTMGPYALAATFSLGVLASTFVYSLFFMNLPVEGEPVEVLDYFRRGNLKRHLLGWTGGMISLAGLLAIWIAAGTEPEWRAGAAESFGISQTAGLIGALWGLFAWSEFSDADFRAKNLLYVTLVLFLCGAGLASVALR
jgi:glucose uptake protein